MKVERTAGPGGITSEQILLPAAGPKDLGRAWSWGSAPPGLGLHSNSGDQGEAASRRRGRGEEGCDAASASPSASTTSLGYPSLPCRRRSRVRPQWPAGTSRPAAHRAGRAPCPLGLTAPTRTPAGPCAPPPPPLPGCRRVPVAAQRVLEEPGELGVPVGHVHHLLALVPQGADHVAQGQLRRQTAAREARGGGRTEPGG